MKERIFRMIVILVMAVMAAAPGPAARPASASTHNQAGLPASLEFVPGQALVAFKPAVSSQRRAQILAGQGTRRLGRIPALEVEVVQLPSHLTVERAVEIFSRLPEVAYAEPNYILEIAQTSSGWQDNQWAPQKIQAAEAWAQIPDPAPATIAVVDTGVDYRHNQLQPNMHVNTAELYGQPGVDDDGNGYVDDVYGWDFYNNDGDPLDDHSHGTHVAGIAAATTGTGATGMTGVCPFCNIMAVKVLGADGSGSLDVVANGIVYAADNGARVINLSLGGALGTSTLQNAVNYAWNQGSVVVAAAGNNGSDTRLYPAAYTNALAVAATNSLDYRSCFSNYGNTTNQYVSVAAPGEAIYATTPLDPDGNDTYATYSGTSMATPHVAGLAGLLYAQEGSRTNAQVRELIEATSEDLGPAGSDPFFGAGRINAYRAVTNNRTATTPPDGLFTTSLTGSGYAHARKLGRDGNGRMHLVWHTQEGTLYRVRYAISLDNGGSWSLQPDVLASSLETYHPALALDNEYIYVAIPQRTGTTTPYQILFTRRSLAGGGWSEPVSLLGGDYQAVRPDLYLDPTNGRLHLAAASLDDQPYVYYRASGDQGLSWTAVQSVNPSTPETASNTRYASVHAHGNNVYLAARTVARSFFTTYYYLHTVRSTDGGATWIDQYKVSSYAAFTAGEYGVSLAGIDDRLYMGYEVGGNLYFRRYDGAGWSDYQQLETGGAWPTISQSGDGQSWLLWEKDGSLLMRHYTGSSWEAGETLLAATGLDKGYYPNLKLGTSGGRVEWVYTSCSGAPFRLVYGGFGLDQPPADPPAAPTELSAAAQSEAEIALSWADNATDETGFKIERSPDGSAGWMEIASAGANSTAYTDSGLEASATYYYRVRSFNDNGDSGYSNIAFATTLAAPVVSEATANGESTVFGARSGDYTMTHSNDGSAESLTEIVSGGKPANRYSYLEHRWTFAVQAGSLVTFQANAWAPASSDGDSFRFEYSPDGSTYTPMFTVAATSDDDVYQSYTLPSWLSGTVTIRVVDTNRTAGHSSVDTVYVDHLVIRSESAPGNPPSAPTNLTATAISDSQIELSWTDSAEDETGFQIERAPDGASWQAVATAGANVTTYTDSGLEAETSYFYQVRAFNTAGFSAPSNPASATTQPATILSMHVGDLDGSAVLGRNGRWDATVTIGVHGEDESLVSGVTVSGLWSGGASGSGSCVTGSNGTCTISKTGLKSNVSSVVFTVTGASHAERVYEPAANHDEEGDSDGTTITIAKPLN